MKRAVRSVGLCGPQVRQCVSRVRSCQQKLAISHSSKVMAHVSRAGRSEVARAFHVSARRVWRRSHGKSPKPAFGSESPLESAAEPDLKGDARVSVPADELLQLKKEFNGLFQKMGPADRIGVARARYQWMKETGLSKQEVANNPQMLRYLIKHMRTLAGPEARSQQQQQMKEEPELSDDQKMEQLEQLLNRLKDDMAPKQAPPPPRQQVKSSASFEKLAARFLQIYGESFTSEIGAYRWMSQFHRKPALEFAAPVLLHQMCEPQNTTVKMMQLLQFWSGVFRSLSPSSGSVVFGAIGVEFTHVNDSSSRVSPADFYQHLSASLVQLESNDSRSLASSFLLRALYLADTPECDAVLEKVERDHAKTATESSSPAFFVHNIRVFPRVQVMEWALPWVSDAEHTRVQHSFYQQEPHAFDIVPFLGGTKGQLKLPNVPLPPEERLSHWVVLCGGITGESLWHQYWATGDVLILQRIMESIIILWPEFAYHPVVSKKKVADMLQQQGDATLLQSSVRALGNKMDVGGRYMYTSSAIATFVGNAAHDAQSMDLLMHRLTRYSDVSLPDLPDQDVMTELFHDMAKTAEQLRRDAQERASQ